MHSRTEALITERATSLLEKLRKAWTDGPGKPDTGMLGKTIKVNFVKLCNGPPHLIQVNYLCGQLAPELFLHRGASLLMAGLMDYYTVSLWTEHLVAEILNAPSCAFCADSWVHNDELKGGRMMLCSR